MRCTRPTSLYGRRAAATAEKTKQKWLHGAHAAYAAQEPQANERTQRMEGRTAKTNPHFKKASKGTLNVPEER
jgi:hypothetical protein